MTHYPLEFLAIPENIMDIFAFATAFIPDARLVNVERRKDSYLVTYYWENETAPEGRLPGLHIQTSLPTSLIQRSDTLTTLRFIVGQVTTTYQKVMAAPESIMTLGFKFTSGKDQ